MSEKKHRAGGPDGDLPADPTGPDVPPETDEEFWAADEAGEVDDAVERELAALQSLIPGVSPAESSADENNSGREPAAEKADAPQPCVFTFSEPPTKAELAEYARTDPKIRERVEDATRRIIRRRAEDDAIEAIDLMFNPDPPPLPREEAPASLVQSASALGHLMADTEEAVAYLLEIGRQRGRDANTRLAALGLVTRVGHSAAALGFAIDRLSRKPRPMRRPREPQS